MTHSTPVLATIQGVRQVIFATQSGLVSLDPTSGSLLWRFAYPFFYSTCIGVSPVVYEDMVFVCGAHAYGMGSVVVQVALGEQGWTTSRLWSTNNPASHWMTPVCHQGFLYGQFGIQQFDSVNGQLKCIDMRTGAQKWSTNGFGRGGTLLVDDHLLVVTERGQLVLVQAVTNAYTEVARFQVITNYSDFMNKCWNTPALSDGRAYIRSTSYAACFDLSVPSLKLEPPQRIAAGEFQLTVRTVDGSPLPAERLAGMQVRTATNFAQPLTEWTSLLDLFDLSNGVARLDYLEADPPPSRFFIVSEPK
jgi:hypothetical protein